MVLKEIIDSIEAGDGLEAWEALRMWYRRFLWFERSNPKFFGGRRKKWWDAIHSYDCVMDARREVIYETLSEGGK